VTDFGAHDDGFDVRRLSSLLAFVDPLILKASLRGAMRGTHAITSRSSAIFPLRLTNSVFVAFSIGLKCFSMSASIGQTMPVQAFRGFLSDCLECLISGLASVLV
jgi:hypothetical protein